MTASCLAFLKSNWLPIGIALALLFALAWYGRATYSRGVQDTENKGRGAIIDQFKERNATDGSVQSMSDPELCRRINGQLRDGRCI